MLAACCGCWCGGGCCGAPDSWLKPSVIGCGGMAAKQHSVYWTVRLTSVATETIIIYSLNSFHNPFILTHQGLLLPIMSIPGCSTPGQYIYKTLN